MDGYAVTSRVKCYGCEFEEECYEDSLKPEICYMGKIAQVARRKAAN